MACNDREAADKLSDYFSGHLNREELDQVARHLSECRECRTSLRTMSHLAGRSPNPFSENSERHLTSQLLTAYYENRESLDAETLKKIESHLKSCERCSYDLYFLNSLEEDLESSLALGAKHESASARLIGSVWALIRKPAFAYCLLLLTLYPAAMWLTRLDKKGGLELAAYLPPREYAMVEQRRSAGYVPTVIRPQDKSLVAVVVPYYHETEEFSYQIFFSDESGSVPLELETITDFSETGAIRVLVQTRSVQDGTYILNISETDREDPSDTLRSKYLFHLKTEQ